MKPNNYSQAEALIRSLQFNPQNAIKLKQLADRFVEERYFLEAASAYSAMVARSTDQVGALLGLARCFLALGDWAGMQAALESVLRLDPNNATAQLNIRALQSPVSGPTALPDEGSRNWFNRALPSRRMQPDLIYDVGMNNGDDTAYYLKKGFRVVAVEADPDLCQAAAKRFATELRDGRLQIVNLGVAAEPGVLEFWICEQNRIWNSFDRKIASRDGLPHHSIPIPCQRFDWILEHYGVPFYLKIDIEGHDFLCLESLKRWSDFPTYLSVEIGAIDRFVTIMTEMGYSGFKCMSQFHFLPLQLPPTAEQLALEAGDKSGLRQSNNWTFPEGASGPFGEDTLGRWLDQHEIRQTHGHYLKLRDEGVATPFWYGASYSFWADLHAKRTPVLEQFTA